MFVDKPAGSQHPLERKQLKWLLAALAALTVVLVAVYMVKQNRDMDSVVETPESEMGAVVSTQPTQEEIQAQLEMLAKEDEENPAPKPTEAEIQKQLEMLAEENDENPAPKPTQEEIQAQLEMLSK